VQEFVVEKSLALGPVIVMLPTCAGEVPEFAIVTACDALDAPSLCAENVSAVGEACKAAAAVAVPDKATCWLPGAALSVKTSVATSGPDACGVNSTATKQLEDAAKEPATRGHVVPGAEATIVKSAAFVPESPMLERLSGALPEFVSFTVCDGLVAPTLSLPKPIDETEGTACGACATPVPVRLIVCCVVEPLVVVSVSCIWALNARSAFG
jgi:hypothetical protein